MPYPVVVVIEEGDIIPSLLSDALCREEGGAGEGGSGNPRELPSHEFRNLYPLTPSSSVAQTTDARGGGTRSLPPARSSGKREGVRPWRFCFPRPARPSGI